MRSLKTLLMSILFLSTMSAHSQTNALHSPSYFGYKRGIDVSINDHSYRRAAATFPAGKYLGVSNNETSVGALVAKLAQVYGITDQTEVDALKQIVLGRLKNGNSSSVNNQISGVKHFPTSVVVFAKGSIQVSLIPAEEGSSTFQSGQRISVTDLQDVTVTGTATVDLHTVKFSMTMEQFVLFENEFTLTLDDCLLELHL